jgi:hypothetical protein
VAARAGSIHHDAPGSDAAVRVRAELVIAVVSVALLVLLAYGREAMSERPPSVFSTYDTGPNGYRALYEVLRHAGVPVRRFESPIGVLDASIATLIFTGYEDDPSRKPFDGNDAAALRRFVEKGGRLVEIDADFAGRYDVAPGVGSSQAAQGDAAVVLARNAYTRGVVRVSGPIPSVFPFSQTRGVPLLANRRGMVAVSYRVGGGEVVAITAPSLFTNKQLREADNLRFAYNAVAGHGAAAFDEYVHGYNQDRTLWTALPAPVHAAVWIVVGIAALALVGANVPFAPPYLPTPPDERDSSDYVNAMAELMRRSRARPSNDAVVRTALAAFRERKEHA